MDSVREIIKLSEKDMEYDIPVIAVLLTCHNRKSKTLKCLNQLFAQKGINNKYLVETFLVDDASTDGTSEEVKERYPSVNIVKGDGHLYWNRGMHLAWKTAIANKKYDFFLWLNDDTYIFSDAVESMLKAYFIAGNCPVICGATKSEITNQHTYGGLTSKGEKIIPNGASQSCAMMNGNIVLIDKNVFASLGC